MTKNTPNNYNNDINKPMINGVILSGNKTSEELHIEGGGGGTSNYENLENRPKINSHTLSGDQNAADLGLSDADTKDSTVTFTSNDATNPSVLDTMPTTLTSGETHKSLLNKISTVIKNVRYIIKLLGSTDISSIGTGTITNAISTLNTTVNNKADTTNIVTSISRSGNTFTAKNSDGTSLFTFSQKDDNTTYSDMSQSELTTGTDTTSRVVRADYLKAAIQAIAKALVVNNLTSTTSDAPLSAAQGKALNDDKLSKSGGTLTGSLTFANNTWNTVGDDILMGDQNVAGALCIKGTNGETRIQFTAYDGNSSGQLIYKNDQYFQFTKPLKTNLTESIVLQTDTVTISCSPRASASGGTKTYTKTGYTPVFCVVTADAWGWCVAIEQKWARSNGTAQLQVFNVGNWTDSSFTVTMGIQVLWVKNS